jgi:hypothetical protein
VNDAGNEDLAVARFREARRRYDTDPAERVRIAAILVDLEESGLIQDAGDAGGGAGPQHRSHQ